MVSAVIMCIYKINDTWNKLCNEARCVNQGVCLVGWGDTLPWWEEIVCVFTRHQYFCCILLTIYISWESFWRAGSDSYIFYGMCLTHVKLMKPVILSDVWHSLTVISSRAEQHSTDVSYVDISQILHLKLCFWWSVERSKFSWINYYTFHHE